MPVFWRKSLTGSWPVLVYVDPYSFSEVQRTMMEVFASAVAAPPFRLLVDRRHCAAPDRQFVDRLVDCGVDFRVRLKGGRVAVVVGRDDLSYGMSRMTQIISEARGLPLAMEVFRDWNEAERWLASADSVQEV